MKKLFLTLIGAVIFSSTSFTASARTVSIYAPKTSGTNGYVLVSAGDRKPPHWSKIVDDKMYQHNIFCWDTNTVAFMSFSFINNVPTAYTTGPNISQALYNIGHRDRYSSIAANGNTGTTTTTKGGYIGAYGTTDSSKSFYFYKVTTGSWHYTAWDNVRDTVTPVSHSTLAINSSVNASGLSFDDIYPIGSIYINVGETLPPIFTADGRTWVRVANGTFLMSADGTNTVAGANGGANYRVLTIANMPAHSHEGGTLDAAGNAGVVAVSSSGTSALWSGLSGSFLGSPMYNTGKVDFGTGNTWWYEALLKFSTSGKWTGTTTAVGEGFSFDNRPYFLAVSMWKRIN